MDSGLDILTVLGMDGHFSKFVHGTTHNFHMGYLSQELYLDMPGCVCFMYYSANLDLITPPAST